MEEEHYSSDELELKVTRKPKCVVTFDVKAKKTLIQKGREQAIKNVSKEVTVPGFRKGKAPKEMLENKFSKAIDENSRKVIADLAFRESYKLTQIPVISDGSSIGYKMVSPPTEEEAEMLFTFETEPTVPHIDPEQLSLEKVKRDDVTPDKVEEMITQIQQFFAERKTITDRPAQEGDIVTVDLFSLDKEQEEPVLENRSFFLEGDKTEKWLKGLLIGMTLGENKEHEKSEADEIDKEWDKFLPKKLKIKLKKIEQLILPPRDEELAKKVGVKNLEEMGKKLEDILNKQADEKQKNAYKEQISKELLEKYPIELPQSLVTQENIYRLKQLFGENNWKTAYNNLSKKRQQEMLDTLTKNSEHALRLFYICNRIAQDEKVSITPDDIKKEISTPLDALASQHRDTYTPQEPSPEQTSLALSRLLVRKAQECMIEKIKNKLS